MVNIFDKDIFRQESEWFHSQTSLYDQVNGVKYDIPEFQLKAFKTNFFGSKPDIINISKLKNESYVSELFMRSCFKKCNKFVLEDWVDYDEVDCTLKCSSLYKEAYKLL